MPIGELFDLAHLLALAREYGYGLIFVGILLENAGVPLPGETITLIGGFLAGNQELSYPLVLFSAVGGAIVGDSCGYWVGRWGGMALLSRVGAFFRIPVDHLETARQNFASNADRAVVMGRFIAIFRIFAGPLAGLAGMPYGRFLICNSLGALLWGVTMTGLAYGAGRILPLDRLVSYVLRFGILALLLLIGWYVGRSRIQIEKP